MTQANNTTKTEPEMSLQDALTEAIKALEKEIERLHVAVTMVDSRGDRALDEAIKDYRRRKRKLDAVMVLRRELARIGTY